MEGGETGDPGDRGADWSRLMAAAQDGDRAAYDHLLRQILPVVRALVRPQHRAADRVEDVVQDVLLTLHRIRHTYDPSRPFLPWLVAITRRRSIDLLRRTGRTEAMEIGADAPYETFMDPRANREQALRHEADGLSAALASLPEGQREAVELLKLRELTLAEASRLTGKSVGALKVNVHRALKSLRARLGGR